MFYDESGETLAQVAQRGGWFPIPGWMRLWANWSSWRCHCWLQGGWNQIIFTVPSNPNSSMILWSLAKPFPREGKPNPALSPALTTHSTRFPFIVASGRQRESKKISATGEGGLVFSLPGCMAHMVIELWENLAAQTGVTAPNPQTHFLIAS